MKQQSAFSSHALVKYLNKAPHLFTKSDIIRYCENNDIKMVNFRYIAADGRLKALSFVINSSKHLDEILSAGERVDGSSLFSFIETDESDLYVVPKYKTVFLNPFSTIPTIEILCSFYDKQGKPFDYSPEYILEKAHHQLKKETGYSFEAMGELEFYLISKKSELFKPEDQQNYHESGPFSKGISFRTEAMDLINQAGGLIKYGHSEVGNFIIDDLEYEQNEIEFLPTNVEDAANQLVIAKWIIRNLAFKYGITVTFAPKISTGRAGNGLHFHTRLIKNGKSVMIKNRRLSDTAKKMIAGYLELAPSLTAFGNTNPSSYLRLVPHQEAPTSICWGDRNRSTLVRVPLGWNLESNMQKSTNPLEKGEDFDYSHKQTVEFRCSDGSAQIHYLLAGLCVAAKHGLQRKDALDYAKKTYVSVNIFEEKHREVADSLDHLPTSCWDSAEELLRQRKIYQNNAVFPERLIKATVGKLQQFNDKNLRQELKSNPDLLTNLLKTHFHCG